LIFGSGEGAARRGDAASLEYARHGRSVGGESSPALIPTEISKRLEATRTSGRVTSQRNRLETALAKATAAITAMTEAFSEQLNHNRRTAHPDAAPAIPRSEAPSASVIPVRLIHWSLPPQPGSPRAPQPVGQPQQGPRHGRISRHLLPPPRSALFRHPHAQVNSALPISSTATRSMISSRSCVSCSTCHLPHRPRAIKYQTARRNRIQDRRESNPRDRSNTEASITTASQHPAN
jgi:hypothetical protein